MSQNQQTPSSQKPQSDDPLASLHRMSTTAGVASQEYVAINLTAVGTLLLGLASATVLMTNVLLVLPILAILCGIVALRQIGNSNGTQSGKAMAILGMLVALGMVGFVVAREVQSYNAVKAEQGRIFAVVEDLSKTLLAKDYGRAASLFTPGFFARKQMDQAAFADRWQKLINSGFYGDLTSVQTNGRVLLRGSEATGRAADTMLVFHFSKVPQPLRRTAELRKDESGEWRFDDLPDLFPTPQDPSKMTPSAPAPTAVMPR